MKAGQQVDWKRTPIITSMGAAETTPYARDAAIASVSRRKGLHALLDQMLCDSDFVQGESTYRLHTALDELLDDSGEEAPERDSEETQLSDKVLDSLGRIARKTRLRSRGLRSTAMDGVTMDCTTLLDEVAILAANQRDDSMEGRISGLRYYLCHSVAPGRMPEAKVVMPLLSAIRANQRSN